MLYDIQRVFTYFPVMFTVVCIFLGCENSSAIVELCIYNAAVSHFFYLDLSLLLSLFLSGSSRKIDR